MEDPRRLLLPDLNDGVPENRDAEPDDAAVDHRGLDFEDDGESALRALSKELVEEAEEFLRTAADDLYAESAGFVSRAGAGLRAPRSRSTNITPTNGGVVWHWVGTPVAITSHTQCAARWRSIQNYHMDSNGWVDVAYTHGVCPHGYVFAGRGAGVRTAANGTNAGNQNYYAICAFIGAGQRPTLSMLRAMLWGTRELRRTGAAGRRNRPHGDLTGSSCPGPDLTPESRRWDNRDIPTTSTPPPPPPEPDNKESDMPSQWAEAAWKKATRLGILDGTRPRDNVTRQEVAVMLERAGLLEDSGTEVPSWAREAVAQSERDGVIAKGTGTRVVRRYDLLVITKRLLGS